MAKLFFRHSPMNAGKSTALLQAAHNYERNGEFVLVAKPSVDTKAGDEVSSRLGISRRVDILVTPETDLRTETLSRIGDRILRCLLIDEAQFMHPDQVDQCRDLATFDDIVVMAYGLRTDFRRRLFPGTQRLFEVADEIEEQQRTMCRCMDHGRAVFNGRFVNGVMVVEGDQVAIDGEDEVTYEPLCSHCYLTLEGRV